mgnify:CR=1 FL=1
MAPRKERILKIFRTIAGKISSEMHTGLMSQLLTSHALNNNLPNTGQDTYSLKLNNKIDFTFESLGILTSQNFAGLVGKQVTFGLEAEFFHLTSLQMPPQLPR